MVTVAVWSLAVAAPAQADRAVALVAPNALVSFDTASPAAAGAAAARHGPRAPARRSAASTSGRPTCGCYGVTVTTGSAANSILKTYAIDPATGVATLVGATATPLAGAGDVPTGLDFNPAVDRIRYVNTNDENARLNPNNGALAGNDTDLTPRRRPTSSPRRTTERRQPAISASCRPRRRRSTTSIASGGGT